MNKTLLFTFSAIHLLVFNVFSQDSKILSNSALAEKIYLQINKEVYSNDEDIWFKAIVTDAVNHNSTILSKVLYVELISEKEGIRDKKLIKIENGIGSSSFKLTKNYQEGTYIIRAHTKWNRNFNSGFIFKKVITIYNKKIRKQNIDPFINTSIQYLENQNIFSIDINPNVIDSLHRRKLKVFTSYKNHKDSLVLKKSEKGIYSISKNIKKEVSYLDVSFITDNNKRFKKRIFLKKEVLDIQFFPESGKFVQGFSSKIGFKAIDGFGKGKEVSGEIVDKNGDFITKFKSNKLGMGSFYLQKVDSLKQYKAILNIEANTKNYIFSLPKVYKKGTLLALKKLEKAVDVTICTNTLTSKNLYLEVSSRGYLFKKVDFFLTTEPHKINLNSKDLPEGILIFKIKDLSNNTILERMYFNQRLDKRVNVNITSNKKYLEKREKQTIILQADLNNIKSDNLSASVLVISKDDLLPNYNENQNILTYFLLDSDLKGHIENPGFYFSKGSFSDLDNLMLTQGWSNYKYTDKVTKVKIQPEFNLTIEGKIINKKKKDISNNTELVLIPIGRNNKTSLFTTKTKVPGDFKFEIGDLYGDSIPVLIQDVKKLESQKNKFDVYIKEKISPKIQINNSLQFGYIDSISNTIKKKGIQRKIIEENYLLSTEGRIVLDEVTIKNRKRIKKREELIEKYGEPDVEITGEEIMSKKQDFSYGAYSVLLFNFRDKVIIERDRNGVLRALANGYKGGSTFIAVDGIIVNSLFYDLVPNIPSDEILQFDIVKDISAKNFLEAYFATYPDKKPPQGPFFGSIINIYTATGKGLHSALNTVKAIKTKKIPVFAAKKQFYAPAYDYDMSQEEKLIPDLRTTLYWNSDVKFNKKGKAVVTFYNSDILGDFIVFAEVISSKGKIGYQTTKFNVSRN